MGTLITTAVGGVGAFIAGTPPRPATRTATGRPCQSVVPIPPVPSRVSRMRDGVSPTKVPPVVATVPSVNQPPTSAMRSVLPAALNRSTSPVLPTLTMTRFATVWPVDGLRFDAVGIAVPSGQAVTYVGRVTLVAVRLRTTAPTPLVGTPPRPVTCRLIELPPATAAFGAPVPSRVSRRRAGTRALKRPAAPGVAVGAETQPIRSATTSACPYASKTLTAPLALRRTSTRFATVWPAVQFRLDASGCAASAGNTVRYEADDVFVTVKFITAA